ncbi:MAG: hypothetical protein ACXACU_11375 [Candidatus Hodarchaeales archaeon]
MLNGNFSYLLSTTVPFIIGIYKQISLYTVMICLTVMIETQRHHPWPVLQVILAP